RCSFRPWRSGRPSRARRREAPPPSSSPHDPVPEPGRGDGGKPGEEPGPEVVRHRRPGRPLAVGPADGPGFPDVEEAEEEEGGDPARPGRERPVLHAADPEGGGGE